MAAFVIIDEIEEQTGKQNIKHNKGLGKQSSLLMITLLIVLVSLTGLPPTVGFTAKFLVFSAAPEAYNLSCSSPLLFMVITASLSRLVYLFYYFKIPLHAFLRESNDPVLLSLRSPKV